MAGCRRAPSWLGLSFAWMLVSAVSCTSSLGSRNGPTITPEELLSGLALGVPVDSGPLAGTVSEVLASSPEMEAFVESHVSREGTDALKLHQLVAAIIDSDTFGVEYDASTRTAAETFRLGRGNCLSFSNMFVALARKGGLTVQFQEVDVPPDWTLDKDTYVLNGHVNVLVDLGLAGKRVVDFNIGDFKASYEMRKIPDGRALAHYYNNLGVERMLSGNTPGAFDLFRTAIADDRQFSPAWTNLGTLYQRVGRLEHAEAAYLQALKAAQGDLVAMSDLARLYERRGDRERAAAYHKKVVYHRLRNPYYRYSLARDALAAGDLGAAIGHLKYAIRKRPKEDQFYFQLGLVYVRKGDERTARRWFARAEEVAATDAAKHSYSRKVDTLLRRGSQAGGSR